MVHLRERFTLAEPDDEKHLVRTKICGLVLLPVIIAALRIDLEARNGEPEMSCRLHTYR